MEDPPVLPTHTRAHGDQPVEDNGRGPLSQGSRDQQHRAGLNVRTPVSRDMTSALTAPTTSSKIAARPVGACGPKAMWAGSRHSNGPHLPGLVAAPGHA
ncbi:hypothetical protein ABZV67_08925 [Streptomyces sp. NPDC005065]|uniref:hypothetical protein n=1 Tax=Streptomyces sp. NPDC005065 TaxID=3154461 RepID=UPI0033B7BF05